jgi:hypothetical protein
MPNINCGHCHRYHDTIADVRACWDGSLASPVEADPDERHELWLESGGAMGDVIQAESIYGQMMEAGDPFLNGERTDVEQVLAANQITDRQMAYIRALQEERLPESERMGNIRLAAITKAGASAMIKTLLEKPLLPKAREAAEDAKAVRDSLPVIPAGRYAVEDNGTLKFYKVDVPGKESKWHGRTFVKVQAGDNEYPVRGGAAQRVLMLIGKDPKAAMLRYGTELGHCGHCGRTLTNEESRAAGIGPICAGKMGW